MKNAIKTGIIGWPVEHSKSPQMHLAAAQALNIDLEYQLYPIDPQHFDDGIEAIRRLSLRGFNVTLPHKRAIMAHLDELAADAKIIGAVNTVVCTEEGRWQGLNTDARGFARSVEETGLALEASTVTILGAGGAARAAAVGVLQAKASRVFVHARRVAQSSGLVSDLQVCFGERIESRPWDELSTSFEQTDLMVQATSATLESRPNARAFADALPWPTLRPAAHVVDLVYAPRRTTVLRAAEEHRHRTIDGLGMLAHQGALAFEAWTGVEPSIDLMKTAIS